MSYPEDEGTVDSEIRQVVTDALLLALTDMERYEDELPQLLVCTDLTTGERTYSGPIPTKERGQLIARHETLAAGADSTLVFSLAPLYPALDFEEEPTSTLRAQLPQPRTP